MLRQTFPHARALGIDRLLVTCDDDNVASQGVIERCGGVLEDKRGREGGGMTRRYWIDLG
jgi:predicted acetyltransferase